VHKGGKGRKPPSSKSERRKKHRLHSKKIIAGSKRSREEGGKPKDL